MASCAGESFCIRAMKKKEVLTLKSKKLLKKLFELTKAAVFFLVVGVLTLYILFEAFLPHQTVDTFGFKPYIVLTRSMEPNIRVDDMVIVTRVDVDTLVVGDIITFLADINYDGQKNVVTHYIYSINTNTAGETVFRTHRHFENPDNVTPDTWLLSESDLLGSHRLTIPYLGMLVRFLQSPFGIAALLVNAGVIVGIVTLIRHDKQKGQDALPKEAASHTENA